MRNRKSDIERYLRGELSPAEMHALEKEALNDPFLAEALEGVEQTGTDNFLYDLHRIKRSVHDRSRRRSAKNSKTIRMWGWTSAIAATVLLVAVSGFLVIKILKDQAEREQAMRELASLKSGDDKKDTVFIPLPQEPPPAAIAGKKQADRKDQSQFAGGGIAVNEAARTAIKKDATQGTTSETVETKSDDQDASGEGFLALREAEEESSAKQEAARQVENAPLGQPEAKTTIPPDDDATRQLDKKITGRVAGEETRARTPALSRASTNDAILVRGKVVSASGGEALPGVNVIINGTRNGTVTDAEGNYELTVPHENTRILFSFIGFVAGEVEVKGQEEINVQLQEDTSALSEVVVTGFASDGASREETGPFSFAEPEGGRADFKKYLNNAIRYPEEALKNNAEGRVTVRFTVEVNGVLSDFEVLKGIGHGCEEELIRAIKEGPSWKPSKQGERPLRDQVKVRFRFELPH